MSVVPAAGPVGRVPRHVWALLIVAVMVLGFALGGTLRPALAFGRAHPARAGTGSGAPMSLTGSEQKRAPTAAVAGFAVPPALTRPASSSFIRSAVRRGTPLPAGSGTGRRIVYQQSAMHLWVVAADGTVLRDYPVTGRPDWPAVGTYHVFTKEVTAASPKYHVTFDWMVSFAHGHSLPIGFHAIPRWMGSGNAIQSEASLGAPIGHGGCVRQRPSDAKWLYAWAAIGTTVVVLH